MARIGAPCPSSSSTPALNSPTQYGGMLSSNVACWCTTSTSLTRTPRSRRSKGSSQSWLCARMTSPGARITSSTRSRRRTARWAFRAASPNTSTQSDASSTPAGSANAGTSAAAAIASSKGPASMGQPRSQSYGLQASCRLSADQATALARSALARRRPDLEPKTEVARIPRTPPRSHFENGRRASPSRSASGECGDRRVDQCVGVSSPPLPAARGRRSGC